MTYSSNLSQMSMQVISEDVGMTLDKADMASLGRAKKATVTKDDTILLDGGGVKDTIEERCEQIREAIQKFHLRLRQV